jgi:uncharacterized protein YkwD
MKTIAILVAMLAGSLISCTTYTGTTSDRGIAQNNSSAHSNPAVANIIATDPSGAKFTDAERQLYDLIMRYRREHGLSTIPMSRSLSLVAKLHVRDLEKNTVPAPYNFHSWSNDGPWSSVNYTPDHRYAKLMWNKPRELTGYRGNGYEIVYMNSGNATSLDAFSIWKSSKLHNDVMMNKGSWKHINWQAIGVGIFGCYAAAWFGEERDPDSQRP